jgi:hypothetical protein
LGDFAPYLVDGNDIYVQASGSTKSLIVKFTWAAGGTDLAPVAIGSNFLLIFSRFNCS